MMTEVNADEDVVRDAIAVVDEEEKGDVILTTPTTKRKDMTHNPEEVEEEAIQE